MVALVTPPDQFYIDRGRPLPRNLAPIAYAAKPKTAPEAPAKPPLIKPNLKERARDEVDLEIIARHEKKQPGRRIAFYMGLSTRRVQTVINAYKAELEREQAQQES